MLQPNVAKLVESMNGYNETPAGIEIKDTILPEKYLENIKSTITKEKDKIKQGSKRANLNVQILLLSENVIRKNFKCSQFL